MLAAAALEPQIGQSVIDAGAGVGGKSTMIAQLMADSGQVTAIEKYSNKIKLLQSNCQRLGFSSITPWQGDLLDFAGEPVSKVFLDAPCSGLGVLRRRSDARYRRKATDISELAALQGRLLDHLAGMVEPGGMLVYTTCTLEAEENEQVVERFLAEHHEYKPLDYPECWRQLGIAGINARGPGYLIDPLVLNTDGMYVARLRRKTS